jgi:hypothetical protein
MEEGTFGIEDITFGKGCLGSIGKLLYMPL